MALHGLYGNGPILFLGTPFLNAVRDYALNPRQQERIMSSVYSMDHKLNVIRYNTALIQELEAEDFEKHREQRFNPNELPRIATYQQRCEFRIHDFDDYLLFLTLFLESFTAASFSLLDVCGFLLNDIYDLQIIEDKMSYVKAVEELENRKGSTDPLYQFLMQYRPGNENSVKWIKPLKQIRNAMTHRNITDVCKHVKQSRWWFPPTHELHLDDSFFNQGQNVVVKQFAQECFEGLEEFVTELYKRLRIALETDQQIPLY
jgi:hypothetical protein